VGVSAATGEGVERLFEAFEESAVEFQEEYLPELLKYDVIRCHDIMLGVLLFCL